MKIVSNIEMTAEEVVQALKAHAHGVAVQRGEAGASLLEFMNRTTVIAVDSTGAEKPLPDSVIISRT